MDSRRCEALNWWQGAPVNISKTTEDKADSANRQVKFRLLSPMNVDIHEEKLRRQAMTEPGGQKRRIKRKAEVIEQSRKKVFQKRYLAYGSGLNRGIYLN